jgi:hypothetical protein
MSESILDTAPEELKSAEAKITYLGEQSKPIATVVFYSRGHQPAMEDFLYVQKGRQPYTNDRSPYTLQFTVEPTEFAHMLNAVGPLLKASVSGKQDFLSFSVVRRAGMGIVGQEFHVSAQSAAEFYPALIGALNQDNSPARAILEKQFAAVFP